MITRLASVWPSMDATVESVISVPQPAEACCGDFDDDEPMPQRDVGAFEPLGWYGEFDDAE